MCISFVAKIVRAAPVTGIVNFPTIPEAASYAQFERYLSAKDVEIEDIYSNQQMVVSHLKEFLEDTYPGLDTQPREFVSMATASNLEGFAQNFAINAPPKDDSCSAGVNVSVSTDSDKEISDRCPMGWEKNGEGSCFYISVS